MLPLYQIPGTSNKCKRELHGKEYNDEKFYPDFQNKLEWFKNTLVDKHEKNEPYVVMRVFDGEFLLLQGRYGGNMARRHVSRQLTPAFVDKFKQGCYKVDVLSTQLYQEQLTIFRRIFPDKDFDLPMEIIYGLLANKWLLKTFRHKIALIGGAEKMKLIKKMMGYEKYRKYVENDFFHDYISVPERYSSNNPEQLLENIGEQIKNSNATVFLYGIGMAKMAIAHRFKEFKNALFIDVGCGITALAGTTSIKRPYFGSWTNFRLKDHDYSHMDQVDFCDTPTEGVEYLD